MASSNILTGDDLENMYGSEAVTPIIFQDDFKPVIEPITEEQFITEIIKIAESMGMDRSVVASVNFYDGNISSTPKIGDLDPSDQRAQLLFNRVILSQIEMIRSAVIVHELIRFRAVNIKGLLALFNREILAKLGPVKMSTEETKRLFGELEGRLESGMQFRTR